MCLDCCTSRHPSPPLCVYRFLSRHATCLSLIRCYSDHGCQRRPAVYVVHLISLISFIYYLTASKLFFSAEPSPVEPIQEEEYELPEQSSPAPPPPRPTKSQPQPPAEDIPPDLPPPRPSKVQSAPPPAQQQDELYEIADSPEDTSSKLPQPPAPLKEEENYEIPGESPPSSPLPPIRPPKIPQPPTPQPSDVSQKETRKFYSICRLLYNDNVTLCYVIAT